MSRDAISDTSFTTKLIIEGTNYNQLIVNNYTWLQLNIRQNTMFVCGTYEMHIQLRLTF